MNELQMLQGSHAAQRYTIKQLHEARDAAIKLIVDYGGIDGAHHKAWVLDQVVRVLAGYDYERIVKEACDGEDGPDTYEWDTGIAP